MISTVSLHDVKKPDPVLIETSGNNIYYNVTFTNTNENGTGEPIPMQFSEIRQTPIFIGPPSDYLMSVVRMTIPADEIPLQIMRTQDGYINLTENSVTMEWEGLITQVYLVWTPEDLTAVAPPAPYSSGQKRFYYLYYSMYSIAHFMKIINVALSAAFDNMVAFGAPLTLPPFMYYDPVTKLISLNAPVAYESDLAHPIKIFINNNLNTNFSNSFLCLLHSTNSADGRDTQLLVRDNIKNRETIAGQPYYVMSQETVSLQLMLSFTSIVITSNSLPIRNEWINIQGSQQNQFLGIVTDFNVQFNTGLEIRNLITYLPTAQYRYTTLQSTLPIENIDLSVYWKTNFGLLVPVRISAYREGNIKILFEKK